MRNYNEMIYGVCQIVAIMCFLCLITYPLHIRDEYTKLKVRMSQEDEARNCLKIGTIKAVVIFILGTTCLMLSFLKL